MTELVDVVIVTHDTREAVSRCLRSISCAETVSQCVVVDNASRDGTAETLRVRHPDVQVIRNTRNDGFARSCNRGAAVGLSPYVLFLNSDIVAHENAVDRLAAFLNLHPTHVVAAGRLVDPETERPQVGFAIRGYPTFAAQALLLLGLERLWPANPISRKQLMRDFDYGVTQDIDAQPAGACLLCCRSAFETIGGFDEQYEFWFEDVDLLVRLRVRGQVAYVHDAVFEHVGGLTVAGRPPSELILARYLGLLRYFKKHRPRVEYVGMRALAVAVAATRGLVSVVGDRGAAAAYAQAAIRALRGT